MKRIYRLLLCLVLMMTVLALPLTANADTGPKPSVVVNFHGIDDQVYYATLLSETDSTGPWSHGNEYYDYYGDENVFWKFSSYEDVDGYYYLSFMDDCTDDDNLHWGYYPPQKFKILLYFPESDQFFCSDEVYERYAFDSYYSVKLSDTMIVQKSYAYSTETLSLIARIILTIAVETAIALLFGYRNKKALKVIVITNIITQIILNVLLNLINFHDGPRTFFACYVLFEIIVFVIEAFIYKKFVDGKHTTFKRAVPYALVANVASIIVGLGVAIILPGIF